VKFLLSDVYIFWFGRRNPTTSIGRLSGSLRDRKNGGKRKLEREKESKHTRKQARKRETRRSFLEGS